MAVLTTTEKQSYDDMVSVYVAMNGQAQTGQSRDLTTTAQQLDNFTSVYTGNKLSADQSTGVIATSKTGKFRLSLLASLSFISASTTRHITYELYNITDATVMASAISNIPRDSTMDTESITAILELIQGKQYAIRIKSSTNITVAFDFLNVSIELAGY